MAFQQFKALEAGTLSTPQEPYRWVNKGEIVHLDEEGAKFYAKSKWLRPRAEAEARKEPPLMSNMAKITGQDGLPSYAKPQPPLPVPPNPGYDAQMKRIVEGEKQADGQGQPTQGAPVQPGGEAAPEGSGNGDPLG